MEQNPGHEVLLSQAADRLWVDARSVFPRSTFDCPRLCQLAALFQEGQSPDLKDFQPIVDARFAAGKVTVEDMVQMALDFLEPKYRPDLTQTAIETTIGETAVSPEVLRMALAIQILEDAWGADIFCWYNVALT